jgi:hypothetical protein
MKIFISFYLSLNFDVFFEDAYSVSFLVVISNMIQISEMSALRLMMQKLELSGFWMCSMITDGTFDWMGSRNTSLWNYIHILGDLVFCVFHQCMRFICPYIGAIFPFITIDSNAYYVCFCIKFWYKWIISTFELCLLWVLRSIFPWLNRRIKIRKISNKIIMKFLFNDDKISIELLIFGDQ